MQIYETDDDYSKDEIDRFEKWFDDDIGTEIEINDSASGDEYFYAVCFDLTQKEVDKVRMYEVCR